MPRRPSEPTVPGVAAEPAVAHHSGRGVQYMSIHHTERLAQSGIEPSVGSVGDSCDNALAETINGLLEAEVVRRRSTIAASLSRSATCRPGPHDARPLMPSAIVTGVRVFKQASPPCHVAVPPIGSDPDAS